MKERIRASLLAGLACAVTVSGCGGGGFIPSELTSLPESISLVATSDPSPALPPPAAPPASPPAAPPTGQSVRPVLFVEKDKSGATYLRVEEQVFNVFSQSAAQRVVKDQQLGPSPGTNFVVEGNQTTNLTNVDANRLKYGLTLQASATVAIYDYTYTQFDGAGSIYGGAIKLGDNDRPTNGPTYIQRVAADGMQAPDATYKVSNNDFLGVEEESGPIFVRDVTGKNFGDAGVDTKSTQVYIMNATFETAHRILRAWPDVEITVVNSIINAAPGHSQAWLASPTSTIRYYNTLWCVGSTAPSPSDPKCSSTPSVIEGDDMAPATAASRVIALQSNPLPGINGFFATQIDQIAVEYSSDGGKTWRALDLPNTGKAGMAPVGDPRYPIPAEFKGGDYVFRASYMKNGVRIGETSQPVDITGKPLA